VHESIFNDLDGSLTGQPGGVALPTYGFLAAPRCDVNLPSMSGGIVPGSRCFNTTFHRINVYGVNPSSIQFRDIVMWQEGRWETVRWSKYAPSLLPSSVAVNVRVIAVTV